MKLSFLIEMNDMPLASFMIIAVGFYTMLSSSIDKHVTGTSSYHTDLAFAVGLTIVLTILCHYVLDKAIEKYKHFNRN